MSSLYHALSEDDDEEDTDNDDDDDDDDDEFIDTESLGNWRNFRRSLTMAGSATAAEDGSSLARDVESSSSSSSKGTSTVSVSKENEELLAAQNQELHQEFKSGVWAHGTSTVRL